MSSVKEIFSDYICEDVLDQSLVHSQVGNLRINKGTRTLSFIIHCDRLFSDTELSNLNSELMNSKLALSKVIITPKFNSSLFLLIVLMSYLMS